MRLLLDTHALIWFHDGDPRLSRTALALILDPVNEKIVSPATYWEVAVKLGTGKYVFSIDFPTFVQGAIIDSGFTVLPVEPRYCEPLVTLPLYHRDPFDRMIVAQAMTEAIPVVSTDRVFDRYAVTRLW